MIGCAGRVGRHKVGVSCFPMPMESTLGWDTAAAALGRLGRGTSSALAIGVPALALAAALAVPRARVLRIRLTSPSPIAAISPFAAVLRNTSLLRRRLHGRHGSS